MKKLEFVDNSATAPKAQETPKNSDYTPSYRDITLRGDFWKLKQKFVNATTWLRAFPAIAPSQHEWLLNVPVYKDKAGVTFASPNTFDRSAVNPFQIAAQWLQKNKKEALSNKDTNPNGLRMYPAPIGVAWVIDTEAEEGKRLRLFSASLYDGSRGGTTGLAYNIKVKADERDAEPGSPTIGSKIHGDITDPATGKLIKIERAKSEKAEYASYSVGIGKSDAPIGALIEKLTEDEQNLLEPLERLIYIPTEDEVHGILKGYLGEELYKEIFPHKE